MGPFGAVGASRRHHRHLRRHHRRPAGAELTRLFFQDIRVQGCTMGSREDFARLLRFVEHADLHPVIDSVVSGLDAAPEAFARMIAGDMFGKIVIEL